MRALSPIETFKANFFHDPKLVHLNNAGIAPLSRAAKDALTLWSDRLHQEGAHCVPEMIQAMETARASVARLLNAPPSQVAFFQGAAGALSQAAFGLDLNRGDEIVVWDQEYPSNFYPWRDAVAQAGARLVVVPSGADLSTPVEKLLEHVNSRTRVIAVSWVQYQTGAITDLAQLAAFARQRGIITVADVIQGMGLLPLDFQACEFDIICGGSHKWLASPIGVGFLCAREEWLQKLKPQAVGALTYGTPDQLSDVHAVARSGAQRFEPGSRPALDTIALGATIDLILETGMARITQEAENHAKFLINGLRDRGYTIQSPHASHHHGAIVNFRPGRQTRHQTTEELAQALQQAGVSFAIRAAGIRLSPHAFNTMDELEYTLARL